MREHPKPLLVEVREGDDVAIMQHKQLLAAMYNPLLCSRLRAEKPVLDENLQAQPAHIQAVPRRHCWAVKWGWELLQGKGAEEGAAWEDVSKEMKRAGRRKSVTAAERPRALIIGEGSGRRTGASTPTTAIMTAFIMSRLPIILGGARAPRPDVTPWGTRLAVKGPKALAGKEGYGLKTP
jgi:hypothetical protein